MLNLQLETNQTTGSDEKFYWPSLVLQYLIETFIGLAIFNSQVSDEVKVAMLTVMEWSSSDESQWRIKIDEKQGAVV